MEAFIYPFPLYNMEDKKMRVKYLKVKDGKKFGISNFPNFSASGSIKGMKENFYSKNALLVRCGSWIYNVSSKPAIYHQTN